MRVSYSRVDCYDSCPYRYNLKYRHGLETIPDWTPDNPLFLGTALHRGIETNAEQAIQEYYMSYPIIDDRHINEAIKLEYLINQCKAMLPEGEHEVEILHEHFKGYIDLLAPVEGVKNTYDIYDFKYSNNTDNYRSSPQLHLYKYFFEKTNPRKKIRNLYFMFVPKLTLKQWDNEELWAYRNRIKKELEYLTPKITQVEYNPEKVIRFLLNTKQMLTATTFPKKESWLCHFCEYNTYCQKGNEFMNLPSTSRRTIGQITKRRIWIYGAAFSGKTTMLDSTPNPLNLNTDGNISFVTMPFVSIKDDIKMNGRMKETTLAWDVFKDTISELEKKENDFKTIIIDLVEDTREMCRIYMYDKLGIQHESDSGFGKGWDIIKTEYLSTMRRFFNLDYENLIIVSHEDVSKDLTKKNGQNVTRIAPNIQGAVANKLAGMVDIVARVVVNDDGSRTLNFKQDEVVFGGGRLKGISETSIPLTWEALVNVYDNANKALEKQNTDEEEEEPTARVRKRV